MFIYLLRRLNLIVITAFILTVLTFILEHWHNGALMTQSNYFVSYYQYIGTLIEGNWGYSNMDQLPILEKGLVAFASTLELCFLAFLSASIIAIPLGILAGLDRNSRLDYIIMSIVLITLALPVFWVSIVMTMLPHAIGLNLPIDGNISPIYEVPTLTGFLLIDSLLSAQTYRLDAFFDHLAHLTLPATVLSLFLITEIIRLTRHSITMVMQKNYIKSAKAKGLSRLSIIFRHVLQNALPSIIHQLWVQISTIISFAMAIEIVFSLPGAGTWLYRSINHADYIALPTAILIISGFILISSILVDIFLMLISPIKRETLYVRK
ncbi:peptide ABC transporter protein inner membrane binding component [Psychromonas sp. CNPT3]|uniref:ABC transporter permease subunit n=1 Tax=Psychromonas sp. CNPT3 TaxID=314282 RepID=UPI00006E481E|nr:ABC transporter permease subunit [Psychromonas sp. CNPT3]AGH81262.1 peptide ABC transporter protein inner membrane binding component [Psychromonas sp. CNPT3]